MWRPPNWWVAAALVFVCCAIYFLRRRTLAASALALAALFATGALTMQVRGSYSEKPLRLGNGEEVVVVAHVIGEGDLQQDAPGSWHQRIDVETEKVEAESQSWETRAGIRLNIYLQQESDSPNRVSMPLFRYGQRIRFPATLNPPRNFRNPGAFDYAGYLRDKGISAAASTKFNSLEVLPGFSGSHVEQWQARIIAASSQKFTRSGLSNKPV